MKHATVEQAKLAAVIREAGAGPRLNVLGVTHVYKAMGVETAGHFSLWEAFVPPGQGAPPHTHTHEDEAFYVLHGEIVVEVEGSAGPTRAGPGSFFFGPRGRRHAYRNEGPGVAHLLIFCVPGEGLDRMFGEMHTAAERTGDMPPMDLIVDIARRHGVTIAPPT
jgi:quercetin dioxygenase-like cupin family protein